MSKFINSSKCLKCKLLFLRNKNTVCMIRYRIDKFFTFLERFNFHAMDPILEIMLHASSLQKIESSILFLNKR